MSTLTRDGILAMLDRRREPVEVPEWGGTVYVQSLSGRERDEFSLSLMGPDRRPDMTKLPGMKQRLLVLTIVDDHGVRLFSDEDADALGEKDPDVIDRIWTVANRLAGLGHTAVPDAAVALGNGQSAKAGSV